MVLLDWPRRRGNDGFKPLSSVALAVGRASLRSLYSCECFLKWRSAPGRAQVSVRTGLWPQDWGTAGEALLSALGRVLSLPLSLLQAPPLLGTPASGSLPCPGLTPNEG